MAYYTLHTMNMYNDMDLAEEGFREEFKEFLKDPWNVICDWIDKIIMSLQRIIYSLKKKRTMSVPIEAMERFDKITEELLTLGSEGLRKIESGEDISDYKNSQYKENYLNIVNGRRYSSFMKTEKSTDSAHVESVAAAPYVEQMIQVSKDLEKLKRSTRRLKKGDKPPYQFAITCFNCFQSQLTVLGKLLSFEKEKTKVKQLDDGDEIEIVGMRL